MLVDEPFRYRITDFDREVFRRFVPTDHPLAVALRAIDWEDLRQTVEAYYSRERGQPAIGPVRMLKLEFLKFWHNLSDRQVMLRTKTDLAFRFFLQVGHTFRRPDFSSLCYFWGRLGEQGFSQVFDGLVAQARRAGLVKDRRRLKDASHVVASIAVPTTLTLVAQIRDRLLAAVERNLNEVLNHHGGRRARSWGRAKVRIQELMTGFVVNMKHIVTLLAALRAEPTMRVSVKA